MPPYNGAFTVGSRVRVLPRSMLEQFQAEWEYHNPLNNEQLEFADTIDVVADVAYYHGGDPLYRLRHSPGTWHETCLKWAD